MTPERRAVLVRERAGALGFLSAGITTLDPVPHAEALDRWLRAGMAGTMAYMHRQAERRKHPATIRRGATRAVVLTRNYYQPDPHARPGAGRVARYARGPDYHDTLRPPLEALAGYVRSLGDDGATAHAFVDAGPVPERELAQRAGLGWIGKNTMLIDPRAGSYFFIASVLTNVDLAPDPPFELDRCGSCTRCLEACPTDAFPQPYVLDATRCISYLTIEHRGSIPEARAREMKDWIFGCDICQEVCPWNEKFARNAEDPILALDNTLAFVDIPEIEAADEATFERRWGWTPMERPGLGGMQRNARVAAANISGGA